MTFIVRRGAVLGRVSKIQLSLGNLSLEWIFRMSLGSFGSDELSGSKRYKGKEPSFCCSLTSSPFVFRTYDTHWFAETILPFRLYKQVKRRATRGMGGRVTKQRNSERLRLKTLNLNKVEAGLTIELDSLLSTLQ